MKMAMLWKGFIFWKDKKISLFDEFTQQRKRIMMLKKVTVRITMIKMAITKPVYWDFAAIHFFIVGKNLLN